MTTEHKNGTSNGSSASSPTVALAIIPRSLADVQILVKSIIGSTLLPEALRREPDIQMAVMTGLELGLTPMMAIRGICVIKGRPTLYAATMVAVVLGRGVAEYFECIEDSATSVTYETKRVGGKNPQRATWTLDDAKRAHLAGDNWSKFPSDMLHARCMSRLARRVYPDVLAGIYTPDEIENITPINEAPRYPDAIDAEVVSDATALMERITAATTSEELNALLPECSALPKDSQARKDARDAYRKRLMELKAPAEVAS
jgi:hypothetical protein